LTDVIILTVIHRIYLFICGLFSDTVGISNYVALKGRVTNEKKFLGETAPSGPERPYYLGFTITLIHSKLGRITLDE